MITPLMACIRATALHYATYKKWTCGAPNIRGYELHRSMRDLVLLCALYRTERRKLYGIHL